MASSRRPWDELEVRPSDFFSPLSLDTLFAEAQPVEIDLGCGEGSFLIEMASRHPEHNFLGIERQAGRVRKVCKKAWRAGLKNVRVLRIESEYFVRFLLRPGSIVRLFLLFPDPWPKKRHHGRRLVQQSFLQAVFRALTPDGELRIKTDYVEYFEHIEAEVREFKRYVAEPWIDPPGAPVTDFERLFLGKGLPIYGVVLRKAGVV